MEHLDPIAILLRGRFMGGLSFKWAANILNDKYLKGCRTWPRRFRPASISTWMPFSKRSVPGFLCAI